MKIKSIKKVVIFLIIILIILLIVVIAIQKDYNVDFNDVDTHDHLNEEEIITDNFEKEKDRKKYYEVKEMVDTFINSITELKTDNNPDDIYILLDESYISEFQINKDNIAEKFNMYDSNDKLYINDMYKVSLAEYIDIYLIYGTGTYSKENIELIIKVDKYNQSFSVFPQEYIEKYEYSQDTKKDEININTDYIVGNETNTYRSFAVNDEQMVNYYFEDFKNNVFQDNSFKNILNIEYRNQKFASEEALNNYLEQLKEDIMSRIIISYQINNYDAYTQYIMIDQYGNYYIFNETAIMEYTVMLDTYTVDLPQFIEEYNNANDAEKAGMNLEKVFTAVNNGDYRYVYNKLDSTFKQNNFPTLESFETYMSETFYDNNTVEYSNYQNNAGLHMYDVSVTNTDDINSSAVTKTFIMQLLDGTDFVMSFNV